MKGEALFRGDVTVFKLACSTCYSSAQLPQDTTPRMYTCSVTVLNTTMHVQVCMYVLSQHVCVCMYVYVCIYIYTCMYKYIHTYICIQHEMSVQECMYYSTICIVCTDLEVQGNSEASAKGNACLGAAATCHHLQHPRAIFLCYSRC